MLPFVFGIEATAGAAAIGLAVDIITTVANAADSLPAGGIADVVNGINAIKNGDQKGKTCPGD